MATAIILVQCERDKIPTAAEKFLEVEGVSEVYSVAGQWDLVAIARVPRDQDLAELVTRRSAGIPGIVHTETLIAFQTFSKYDLDRLFSIGLDE